MTIPKLIAFHLPQFHSFPENDEWWGKGFTEWTNTKKAKPQYKNHFQPREPLNNNYYNLLDKDSLIKQANLARKYNIYGFCFYHYWFNGKMLMEKPLSIILNNKDININFCFCWANEPWTRSWDGQTNQILIDQKYGDKSDWIEHFNYLLNFFKDNRYIKIDNKPVIVLYSTNRIYKCDEMILCWNQLAQEHGFSGVFTVAEKNSYQDKIESKKIDGILYFEPMYTSFYDRSLLNKLKTKSISTYLNIINKKNLIVRDYSSTWKKIIKRNYQNTDIMVFPGAYVDWDNTARRGKNATIYIGASPSKFRKYFELLYKSSIDSDNKYIFINAWNEWAEGAYLEPDKKNKYSYLESINEIVYKYNGANKYED